MARPRATPKSVRPEAGRASSTARRSAHTWQDHRQHSGGARKPPNSRSRILIVSGSAALAWVAWHNTATISSLPALAPSAPPSSPVPAPPHTAYPARSPAEPRPSLLALLNRYLLEPALTLVRFIHLALLFGPVILTAPMLLVGSTTVQSRRGARPTGGEEERWGAVWWYGFLVKQMERAGPTFIKVRRAVVQHFG